MTHAAIPDEKHRTVFWIMLAVAVAATVGGLALAVGFDFRGTAARSDSGAGEPSGLHAAGALDVGGCQIVNGDGQVAVWNPGSAPQSVSAFGIEWEQNGIEMSQQNYQPGAEIPSRSLQKLSAEAPPGATSCDLLGWNP